MAYTRTHYGWRRLCGLLVLLSTMGIIAWSGGFEPVVFVGLSLAAVLFAFLALAFGFITICDEDEWLALRRGPVPLFHERIRYDAITGITARRARTLGDRGFDWVNVWCGRKVIRIASDDKENLIKLICEKAHLDLDKARTEGTKEEE